MGDSKKPVHTVSRETTEKDVLQKNFSAIGRSSAFAADNQSKNPGENNLETSLPCT